MGRNLETTQQIYAAFGRGDVPAILEHIADDAAWESWADHSGQREGVPWLAGRTGPEGAAEFFGIVGSGMEVRDFKVHDFLESGNQVAVEVEIEAGIRESGGAFRDEELHLWTFGDDGKVVRMRHYTDTAKHIEAHGGGTRTG